MAGPSSINVLTGLTDLAWPPTVEFSSNAYSLPNNNKQKRVVTMGQAQSGATTGDAASEQVSHELVSFRMLQSLSITPLTSARLASLLGGASPLSNYIPSKMSSGDLLTIRARSHASKKTR